MVSVLVDFIRELLIVFSYPFLAPFTFLVPVEKYNPQRPDKPVILIVFRWFSYNPYHLIWKRYLERRGFSVYYKNFSFQKGNFEDSALLLKKFIEKNQLHDVRIIGISSGAITSLVYLEKLNGWERVNTFIGIAPPYRGTPLALHLSFLPSGREILTINHYFEKHLSGKLHHPERMVTLLARVDEMVPHSSSQLPGVRTKVIDVWGHNNLHLYSAKTYRLIVELLKKGS